MMDLQQEMNSRAAPVEMERRRAIAAARVILRAPNINPDSDIALVARHLLRALNLPEQG